MKPGQFITRLLRFLGLGSDAGPFEPQILLERVQHALSERIAKFNETLAASAAYCEVLREQIGELEVKQEASRLRLASFCEKGQADPRAGNEARLLQDLQREEAELRDELDKAETTRSDVVAAREAAIRRARGELEKLKGAVDNAQFGKAMAEVRRLAAASEPPE